MKQKSKNFKKYNKKIKADLFRMPKVKKTLDFLIEMLYNQIKLVNKKVSQLTELFDDNSTSMSEVATDIAKSDLQDVIFLNYIT